MTFTTLMESPLAAVSALESPVAPVLEPALESAPESAAAPALEPVVEPALESAPESAAAPALEPVVEPALEPVVEPPVAPALEPALDPALEPALDPAWVEREFAAIMTAAGFRDRLIVSTLVDGPSRVDGPGERRPASRRSCRPSSPRVARRVGERVRSPPR